LRHFSARVIELVGFHARPTAIAVEESNKYESEIRILYNEKSANLKSISQVMKMGIPYDAKITISCEGSDEDIAICSLENILRKKSVIR
jgi:phosphocarrier protein HPr